MSNDWQMLTEREKQALRLLLGGHDAKSIARTLGLSVHTINERFRDARRKLGVASSREAARLLAEAEGFSPNFLTDKQLGVARPALERPNDERPERSHGADSRIVWFVGGMLIMSLVIVAIMLSSALQGEARP